MSISNEVDGRRQRSLRTRARIVGAAAQRFVDHGYVGTTIESVAELAGVAVQTVYYVFGTKPNLLAAVLDASIVGDAEPIPVVERPWVEAVGSETDATAAVEQLVAACVTILVRAAPAYEVVRRAAADPEVGALLTANRMGRRQDQRRMVEKLWAAGHLRFDLDLDPAADAFYALVNEEVFQLLVVDCSWDIDRFRNWLTSAVLREFVTRPED